MSAIESQIHAAPPSPQGTLRGFLAGAQRKVMIDRTAAQACRAVFWVAIGGMPLTACRSLIDLSDAALLVILAVSVVTTFGVLMWGKRVRLAQVPDHLRAEASDHDRIATATEFMNDPDLFKQLSIRQAEEWIARSEGATQTKKTWPRHALAALVACAIHLIVFWLTPSMAHAQPPVPSDSDASAPSSQPTSQPSPAENETAASDAGKDQTAGQGGGSPGPDTGSPDAAGGNAGNTSGNAGDGGSSAASGSAGGGQGGGSSKDSSGDAGGGSGSAAGDGGKAGKPAPSGGAGSGQGDASSGGAKGESSKEGSESGDAAKDQAKTGDSPSAGKSGADGKASGDGKATEPNRPGPGASPSTPGNPSGPTPTPPAAGAEGAGQGSGAAAQGNETAPVTKQPADRKATGPAMDVSAGQSEKEKPGTGKEMDGRKDPDNAAPQAAGGADPQTAYSNAKVDPIELEALPPKRRKVVTEYFRRSASPATQPASSH